jgi:hypothetical protein
VCSSDLTGSAEKVDFDPQQTNPLQAGGGGNGGEPTDPGDGGGLPNPAAPLPEPVVMPGGGTYPHQEFPATVSISANGAPPGDSVLEWRINENPWVSSGGTSVAITAGDRLQARNVPAPGVTTYAASAEVTHEYYRMVDGFNATVEATFVNPQGGGIELPSGECREWEERIHPWFRDSAGEWRLGGWNGGIQYGNLQQRAYRGS